MVSVAAGENEKKKNETENLQVEVPVYESRKSIRESLKDVSRRWSHPPKPGCHGALKSRCAGGHEGDKGTVTGERAAHTVTETSACFFDSTMSDE